jgi:hypothetical protein
MSAAQTEGNESSLCSKGFPLFVSKKEKRKKENESTVVVAKRSQPLCVESTKVEVPKPARIRS